MRASVCNWPTPARRQDRYRPSMGAMQSFPNCESGCLASLELRVWPVWLRRDPSGACRTPTSLQEQRHLQQVAYRLAFGDYVVRECRGAEADDGCGRNAHDRKLGVQQRRAHDVRRVEEARAFELPHQQLCTFALGKPGVVCACTPARASSSATTSSCTSEFWRISRAARWKPNTVTARRSDLSLPSTATRPVRCERGGHDVQIGQELLGPRVRRHFDVRRTRRRVADQRLRGRGGPRISFGKGLPVRLVASAGIVVVCGHGEREERFGGFDQARRERKLSSEGVHFVEVMPVEGRGQHARGWRNRALTRRRTDCRRDRRRSTSPSAKNGGSPSAVPVSFGGPTCQNLTYLLNGEQIGGSMHAIFNG